MSRNFVKLMLVSLFAGMLAVSATTKSEACAESHIASYSAEFQHALEKGDLSAGERARLAALLELTRTGSGPLWLGARQDALNEALRAIGHKETGLPPLSELTDEQREDVLHRRALASLGDLVELQDDASLSSAAHQKLADAIAAVRLDLEQGKWQSSIDHSTTIEQALGIAFPAKCGSVQ